MDIKDYKILYMGTPKISADCLDKLINDGFNIIGVISQADKEIGRKKILTITPTKEVAIKYNIPIYQPNKIKEDFQFIKNLNPDLILTFSYGQILPHELLSIPKYGCLNLHGSILPKYRGAAPIQRAIMNGENTTGITLMEMVDKMDAGKIYATKEVKIEDYDNYSSLIDKLSNVAFLICKEKLMDYFNGNLIGINQDESKVSYASKISKEEEKLNLNLNVKDFINYVRSLSLIPGGYLYLNNQKLKILTAKFYSNKVNYHLGELALINKKICLQLIDGLIELIKIQPENKNVMNILDFYNGHKNIIGQILK